MLNKGNKVFLMQIQPLVIQIEDEDPLNWTALIDLRPALILLSPSKNRLHYCRQFFEWLKEQKMNIPVILHFTYQCVQYILTFFRSYFHKFLLLITF